MDNLVIGNTSQLSAYFPKDYIKISSRDIDYDFIVSKRWEKAFICFAEQRTFLEGSAEFFFDVNYSYTIDVINRIKESCDRIFFYSTTYLWNAYEGAIDLTMPYKYHETPYIKSKEQITKYTKSDQPTLVVFGSPEKGIHEILGGKMKNVQNAKSLNFFPNQATQTVRLEEALLGTLSIINAQSGS